MSFFKAGPWCVLVVLVLTACRAHSHQPAKPAPDREKLQDVKTSELIDRLRDISDEGIGTHSTAWADGFLAIDEEPRFRGGVLGSRKPAVSPVMRELVRRGVEALPELLEHVQDARSTKLVVGKNGILSMRHSDEYDPRHQDPKRRPRGVNTGREADASKPGYTLAVGDLCYVAVGQIVNRDLNAVRYQPSACLVINSPVATPALAEAVKRDWKGLTAEQHERSLLEDARNKWGAAALARLLYYYPRSGRSQALRMLDRPFYDRDLVFDFFLEKMVPADGDDQRRLLMAEFRKVHGEAAYQGVLHALIWASTFPESQMTSERRQYKKVADGLLSRYFPWVDPASLPFLNAVSYRDQEWLIEGLAAFRTPELDSAILEVFHRGVARDPASISDRLYQVDLAFACARRLKEGVPQDELRRFLAKRLREFKEALEDPSNASLCAALNQRIGWIGEELERPGKVESKGDGVEVSWSALAVGAVLTALLLWLGLRSWRRV
jgi:hypothetical protein